MNRVLAAARLYTVHAAMALGLPWLVVGCSFAVNLAVWAPMPDDVRAEGATVGVIALYITVLVVFLQAVTQMFPMALGVSLSRRTFYLGTLLAAVVQSVVYGVVLTGLVAVEGATGGWGMQLRFWAPGRLDVGDPVLQTAVFGALMMVFAATGVGLGVVVKRWGPLGMWMVGIVALLVSGMAVAVVTWQGWWAAVWAAVQGSSTGTLFVLWPMLAAGLIVGVSFLGLRRAVP